MARMKKQERIQKQSQGRQLYASGFSFVDIASIIGVTQKTLRAWAEEDKWEEEFENYLSKKDSSSAPETMITDGAYGGEENQELFL